MALASRHCTLVLAQSTNVKLTLCINIQLALQVKLSDDYAKYGDADEGPLSPGDIGTLVEDDGSSAPYKVRAASGKTWWYKKEAIVKAEVLFQTLGRQHNLTITLAWCISA